MAAAISEDHLKALQNLWDVASEALESPDADFSDVRASLADAIERCQSARSQDPFLDLSGGLGEAARSDVIDHARETAGDDGLEFDPDASLSVADDGIWVQGWVWFPDHALPASIGFDRGESFDSELADPA